MSSLISIIVPCFNGRQFVERALDCLRLQSHPEIEAVVIDDGSQDDSVALVRQYQARFPQLKLTLLINPRNLGVSASRNRGIEAATGDYLCFLDCDDQVEPDFCQHLLSLALENQAEFVVTNASRVRPDGTRRPYSPCSAAPELLCRSQFEKLARPPKLLSLLDPVCGKLYLRNFLLQSQIRFKPEIPFGEDTLFAHTALLLARQTVFDSSYCGYLYYDSIATSCSNSIQLQKRLHSLQLLLQELDKLLSPKEKFILLRKSTEYIWTIRKLGGEKKNDLLEQTIHSSLWEDIIFPTIAQFGKTKHRLLAHAMNKGWLWTINFF